jgi:hypothetical protein
MKEFAVIRAISGRQILFYTESNSDGSALHILARTSNDINVNMSMNYDDREQDMWDVFQKAKEGELDDSALIRQLIGTIEEMEKDDD